MSLEAVEKVKEAERAGGERRAAASAQAKKLAEDAETEGLALCAQVQSKADAERAALFQQAEARAKKRTEAICREARQSGDALKAEAGAQLEKAAQLIVERVVK